MWASRGVKAWVAAPSQRRRSFGALRKGSWGSGALRVKAHCCLRCTAYTCRGRPAPSQRQRQVGILTGFRCGGLRLEMAAVPLSGRHAQGLAPPAPARSLRSPGRREQMPQVPRGAGGRTPCCLHRARAPALLSPELWAVASARERSVLWKEERKCKRCWAGGKAARGCGQGRRSGWAVLETILPGALHPQPGCCAGFPAETCVLRSPGHTAGASSCRPHVRPRGRCVWGKVSIARRQCISSPGEGQGPVELDVSGPRVGF